MTARTVTPPPTDRSMWRRLLRRCHPDAGGSADLFVWARELREHVGDDVEDVRTRQERRRPPRHHRPAKPDAARVPFVGEFVGDFRRLTARACGMAPQVEEPYGALLRMLGDCQELSDVAAIRQQTEGATFRSLAHVGHLVGMNARERGRWYELAASIPLSQRHAGHLISKLKRRAA